MLLVLNSWLEATNVRGLRRGMRLGMNLEETSSLIFVQKIINERFVYVLHIYVGFLAGLQKIVTMHASSSRRIHGLNIVPLSILIRWTWGALHIVRIV